MRKIQCSEHTPLIECINPIRNHWKVRADKSMHEEGFIAYEHDFDGKPKLEQIKDIVLDHYNGICEEIILSGLTFEGSTVWLTQENQFNYKAAWDFAHQTDGASLPVTFKFGDASLPVYKVFDSMVDLQAFIEMTLLHINSTLAEYWTIKDGIDWSLYDV